MVADVLILQRMKFLYILFILSPKIILSVTEPFIAGMANHLPHKETILRPTLPYMVVIVFTRCI